MEQTAPMTTHVAEAPAKGKKKRKKKRNNKFKLGMICYVVVFFTLVAIGLKFFWDFLGEYEDSRPIHAMEAYIPTIDTELLSQLAADQLNEFQLTPYETTDILNKKVEESLPETPVYSFGKHKTYTDDFPTYQIISNDMTIATVELSRSGRTKLFHFPVWNVGQPKASLEISMNARYTVDVLADSDTVVMVNGVPLTDEYIADRTESIALGDSAAAIAGQPYKIHYVLPGLYQPPVVTATLNNGEPLLSKIEAPDATVAKQSYDFTEQESSILAAEQCDYMLELCKTYINYVMNNGRSPAANLSRLKAYLLADGEAARQMESIRGEIAWNQQYTSREDKLLVAEHFRQYSDNCFSCETRFEMVLSKEEVTNNYNGTVRWYMIRTEEGWRAAKMEIL